MGPIDFAKFTSVKNEYVTSFNLRKLSQKLSALRGKFAAYNNFIDLLDSERKLELLITADNTQLQSLKDQFDLCEPHFEYADCPKPVTANGKTKECGNCATCLDNATQRDFHEKVMNILNYENKGKESLRKVYPKIGMKACYVCNAQYTIAVEPEPTVLTASSQQARHKAKFQFDHYFPKAKYPALSISLYNLFPICSSCNSIKGDRDMGIDYLSVDPKKWNGKFSFSILESTLTYFLLDQDPIEIDFTDDYDYDPANALKLSDRFDIKGIYNTQIDLIEELIIRKLKYSETYKNKLSDSFPQLFEKIKIEERIELGTYSAKDGIHKRPMSKFIQDIDLQLDEYFSRIIL